MKKLLCIFLAAICVVSVCGCGDTPSTPVTPGKPAYTEPAYDQFTVSQKNTVRLLQSTDAVGRSVVPLQDIDESKKVGLFYFLWMGQHDQAAQGAEGCAWDSARLSEEELKGTAQNKEVGVFHYWSEPLYDYYNSEDAWVFRKHLELFVMAGIDYLVFDVSNSYYYPTVCKNIFPVALELIEQGWEIPKFMFYCHTKTKDTVTGIYNDFYDADDPECRKYDKLWYTESDNGKRNTDHKPWIIIKNNGTGDEAAQNYDKCDEKIKNRYYTRELRWNREQSADRGWLFPSDIDEPSVHEGMISVSVAQHTSGAFSDSVFEPNMRDGNRGRGWVWNNEHTSGTNVAASVNIGTNYQSEWEYALGLGDDVNNIFLSTFNEWVAQKQPFGLNNRSSCYFVDQFNPEFSRDIEPVKGLWGDNYYLQTMEMVRRFKAKSNQVNATLVPRRNAVQLDGDATQWENTVGYLDFVGDTAKRNYKSSNLNSHGNVPNTVYKNETGRNDIAQVNITCDERNVYFRIVCADDITAYENGDATWMNILVEVDGQRGSHWENYQYVINRTVTGNTTYIERLKSDGSSDIEAVGALHLNGKTLTVSVPQAALGITTDSFTLNFKVADHVTNYKDISDYYVNGDSAPIGRLNYVFSV